ncbi:MAG: hypothetical protein HC884_19545, partial [Chloroflexaceae bacterium]|nr:hypothetical protein [Chloroflexaceae bacterium]
ECGPRWPVSTSRDPSPSHRHRNCVAPYMGALAYALRTRELLGVTATGYQPFVNTRAGTTPRYAIIREDEDPREYGMATTARLWGDGRAALYAVPPERLAWLSGRPTALTEGSLLMEDTTWSRARLGIGDYLEVSSTSPLTLDLGSETIGLEPGAPPPPGSPPSQRTVDLALASFGPQTIALTVGEGTEQRRSRLDIPAGASFFRTGAVTVPTSLTLRGGSADAPLLLRWASLSLDGPEAADRPVPVPSDDTLLLGVSSEPQAGGSHTTLQVANPGNEALRLAVEIYEDRAGYDVAPAHYAWSLVPLPPDGPHRLELDLLTPAMHLDGTPLPVQTEAVPVHDGSYFAALWVYQGEQVRRVVPFLRFERHGPAIETVTPFDVNAVFVGLRTPATLAPARFGDRIALRGFELDAPRLQPGKRLWVSLLWEAEQAPEHLFLVFVQVLDENDHKIAEWNGEAGGAWHSTPAWKTGQRIWQDVPLDLAADAPPGNYRVIAGVFDPTTGERLRQQDGRDFLLVGNVSVEEVWER